MKKTFNIYPNNLAFYRLINNKSDAINYLLEEAKTNKEFLNRFFTPEDLKILKKLEIINLNQQQKSNLKKLKSTDIIEEKEEKKTNIKW